MRYKNISLNDNNGNMYYLIKYSDAYKDKEEQIEKFNEYLASSIISMPSSLSELSDHQGYMLLDESSNLLGLVIVGSSCNEKDLELEVEFDDEKLKSLESKVDVFNTLLDKLELFFYDKDNIEIEIHNDIDLSKIDPKRFKRMSYSENLVTYVHKNEKKDVISRLIEEIRYASGDNSTLGKRNGIKINNEAFDISVDKDLLEEVENGNIPLTEIFNKINSLEWTDIVDLSHHRIVKASKTGHMKVTETANYMGSYPESKYVLDYNVSRPGFTLVGELFDGVDYTDIKVEDHRYYTRVSYDRMTFIKAKESGKTKIIYRGPKIGTTSVAFEMYGEDDTINRLNVDIKNHKKSTGKVNGTYALRFHSRYKECKWSLASLRYYNRSGLRSADYCKYLEENDPILIEDVIKNGFNGENVQQLINATVKTINGNINYFPNVHHIEIPNFEDEYNKVTSIVTSIQENTPLPFLREQLSAFSNSGFKKEKTEVVQKKKKF